jgi:signal transduction histidine kinase
VSTVRGRLSRLPLRLRLVAGFSAAMFVVLLGAGIFVYWRVAYALDRGLDTELSQAAQTIDGLVQPGGTVSDRSSAEATGVAWQVLDPSGAVLDHGGAATSTGMVSAHSLAKVGATPRSIEVGDFLPASPAPYRLQVTRIPGSAPPRYLLVGVRRDHRDEALRELLAQLAVAGVAALAITSFVGDRLARAALRPVERYRRRAAEIAEGAHDLRLEVPAGRDDEVTRLGHTFNDMLATLERALDRERHFVNEASHELRTPITLLTSRIQLARRRPRSVAEHERILAELQVDLDRLARLAEQLLQLGAATGSTDDAVSDLGQVVSRVVEGRARAGTTPAEDVVVELPAGPAAAAIAEVEAERVLTNLLDNARVHGAAPYRVVLDRPAPAWVRLSVSDAGPGMPPELLADATQRFARADDARSRPGAGLGLALVDTLVDRAGGELRLCFAGHHTSHGHAAPVACDHGPQMTVTVLLPGRSVASPAAGPAELVG